MCPIVIDLVSVDVLDLPLIQVSFDTFLVPLN